MPPRKPPPRDKEDTKPLTPEEREQAIAKRAAAAESGEPVEVRSGFILDVRVMSATIEKGEIRCQLVVSGMVERPEATAIANGETVFVAVPAKITRTDDA